MHRIALRTIVVALVVLAVAAPIALAHVSVRSTSPRAGSTVGKSLANVKVTYSGTIKSGSIRVTGPEGVVYSRGRGGVDPRNDKRLVVRMKSGLVAGRYTARWNIVAGDGHAQRGSFSFRVN